MGFMWATAGWHLLYDALVSEEAVDQLKDEDFIHDKLVEIASLLEMEILMGPFVKSVPLDMSKRDCEKDEGGITGILVVTTSHVSIHTWPLRRYFSFDAFSCKTFDNALLEDFMKEHFGVVNAQSHWIRRVWP